MMMVVVALLLVLAISGMAYMFWRWHKEVTHTRALEIENAVVQARLAEMQRIADPAAQRELLSNEFKSLSQDILQAQGAQTAERARTDLNLLLEPMKKEVGEFRGRVEDLLQANTETKSMLMERFKRMDESVGTLSADATQLTEALRGDTKVRGDWGEVQLARALESAGLQEGSQGGYETQRSFVVDGARVVPDVVLHLPGDRHVVIDAKVSLVDYINYRAATDGSTRKVALKGMERAMTKQVEEIHSKYLVLPELVTMGFAIMFTPLEPAWQLAMCELPSLFEQARKKGVIIVGPTTLLATLRLLEEIWRAEHGAQNVRAIIARAGKLHDASVRLYTSVQDVKQHVQRADKSLQDLERKIEGRQGVLTNAVKLKELGAKTTLELPTEVAEVVLETQATEEIAVMEQVEVENK